MEETKENRELDLVADMKTEFNTPDLLGLPKVFNLGSFSPRQEVELFQNSTDSVCYSLTSMSLNATVEDLARLTPFNTAERISSQFEDFMLDGSQEKTEDKMSVSGSEHGSEHFSFPPIQGGYDSQEEDEEKEEKDDDERLYNPFDFPFTGAVDTFDFQKGQNSFHEPESQSVRDSETDSSCSELDFLSNHGTASHRPNFPPQYNSKGFPDKHPAEPQSPKMQMRTRPKNRTNRAEMQRFNRDPYSFSVRKKRGMSTVKKQNPKKKKVRSAAEVEEKMRNVRVAEKEGFIGAFGVEERKQLLERFFQRRAHRKWHKIIRYPVRKKFADSRMRVKGRFISKKDNRVLMQGLLMVL